MTLELVHTVGAKVVPIPSLFRPKRLVMVVLPDGRTFQGEASTNQEALVLVEAKLTGEDAR